VLIDSDFIFFLLLKVRLQL